MAQLVAEGLVEQVDGALAIPGLGRVEIVGRLLYNAAAIRVFHPEA